MKNDAETTGKLLDKALKLPLCPGVYIMKDRRGKVIYVGKSRKLKNRVSQYFHNSEKNIKTARMVSNVDDFDYIVCDTEIEALSLENTLIKQYTPKYNIKLKDARSYPYIKITAGEYPKVVFTRKRLADKAKYYGPFSGTSIAFSVLSIIHRDLGIPSCNRNFPKDIGKERPCLYYQMGQCCGVCTGKISREEYAEIVKLASDILRGNTADVRKKLEEQMINAASEERFETAAHCRDAINSLKALSEKQKVLASPGTDQDIIGLFSADYGSCISVLNIRDGLLNDKTDYPFGADRIIDQTGMSTFFCDYYRGKDYIPHEIYTSFEFDDEERELVESYLSSISTHKVSVHKPLRGKARELCEMADENAKEKLSRVKEENEKDEGVLVRLSDILGLEVLPERIEAYDISNFGSEFLTAGMIVVKDGKFSKKDYRSFSIKSVEGTDDYASMKEALTRRLSHLSDESGSFSEYPDLLLIDGGKGHVSSVREVLDSLELDIPVFGMVKDDYHKTRALCDAENEISIAHEQSVFTLIYKIQEEVHRFTVSKMENAKGKTIRRSSLENIAGIGASKAKILLSYFGGLAGIKEADVDEIAKVKGISRANAESVYNYFHKEGAKF